MQVAFRFFRFFIKYSILGTLIVIVYANTVISTVPKAKIYYDVDLVPHNRVGLLLGTSKYVARGRVNKYFEYRLDAIVTLYEAGKVDYILASGDNAHRSYNEPRQMREELLRRGVPEDAIYLDYAGFSTFDSIVRINRVFGQFSFTVVSQAFQVQRALYIANEYGLSAVGFAASDVQSADALATTVREYLARVKALLDLHVLGRHPHFLGEPIRIGDEKGPSAHVPGSGDRDHGRASAKSE